MARTLTEMGAPSVLAALTCHPETQTEAVRAVEVRVWRGERDQLSFRFSLQGDLTRLRVPSPRPQKRAERLWQHTCFEAFIGHRDSPAYHEFNFSPSGEWAAYAFRGYRDRDAAADHPYEPRIEVRRLPDRLELDADIALDRLQWIQHLAVLKLGLSAVIEEESGALSYWALKNPAGKPDFHRPDALALELDLENRDQ
jgi:hypothetical protein